MNEKEPVVTQGRPRYAPRDLKPSTLGTAAVTYLTSEPSRSGVMTAPGGGLEKHEAAGGTGKLIFQDCDGAEVGRIEWKNGKILTDGEQTIECGCDGGTSSIG